LPILNFQNNTDMIDPPAVAELEKIAGFGSGGIP
jgi:hypothetical protein